MINIYRSPIVQPIKGYLYRQVVTLIKNADLGIYKENQQVYAKPLQLYKGVDNKLQLVIRDSEQKPVNLTGCHVQFNLTDTTTSELVFSRNLQVIYNLKGVASCTLENNLLIGISAGLYNYSVMVISAENEQQVVYGDDNYQAQGKARISASIYGQLVPSVKPTILAYHNNSDTHYHTVAFTDVIQTADRVKGRAVLQTVQYNCTDFTGTIEVQVTLNANPSNTLSNWGTVETMPVDSYTGNGYFTFQGKYNSVRFRITKDPANTGDVNYILYRS